MLEISKTLNTIAFKMLLVIILKDITMDNQQETKVIFIKLQVDPQRLYVKAVIMVWYNPIM